MSDVIDDGQRTQFYRLTDPRIVKIDVLDHGFVRLDDLAIVRAARVSYDAAWRAGADAGSDAKLIRYLWKHQHTTPFEAVEFQFEVKAPIFVLRQWHRHQTWSFNELSARYRELPEEFYVPASDQVGAQSPSSKQARIAAEPDEASPKLIRAACESAFSSYHDLLARGVPRELARSVLPVATYSHMLAKTDLRNLFHFLSLRRDAHAQYEIRVFADAMLQLIRPVAPIAVSAWEEQDNHKGDPKS
jgi:thymidylate synthase (FAD)